ncbi:MAG: hypothetical protein K2M13_05625 [Muribaculaceae bacterium]|nr:hypothetical protein [Muribaculaceae bacterium]
MESTIQRESTLLLIIKKIICEKKKNFLYTLVGLLGGTTVLGFWAAWISSEPTWIYGILVFLCGLACALVASMTFSENSTKEGRIAFLMTPGSAMEKYLPRVIISVVGMVVLSYISFLTTTVGLELGRLVTRQAMLPITDLMDYFSISILSLNTEQVAGVCILISLFLFMEGLYVCGSALWPRKSFLKTTGVFIALQWALSILGVIINSIVKWHFIYTVTETEAMVFLWMVCAFFFILDFLLFFAAYIKIKRLTV